MVEDPGTLWTIDALGDAVVSALSAGYEGQPNGQVRDVPDRRTIRYYTTLGLIDRPKVMRGRTALYGRRHLLQLVAIKRLQARGLSLSEVQGELAGATDGMLRRIARIPEPAAAEGTLAAITEETGRRTQAFWGTMPAEMSASSVPARAGAKDVRADLLLGVPIREDLTLLLSSGRALEEEDLRAIREAARPLVELLKTRGLLPPAASKER